jgi:hypothetical protein
MWTDEIPFVIKLYDNLELWFVIDAVDALVGPFMMVAGLSLIRRWSDEG